MGTIEENLRRWTGFDWKGKGMAGDSWSSAWGGTAYLWYGTIMPRVKSFLPTGNILEIAPGFGRITQFLVPLCDRLTLVDLTDECIEACKKRFQRFSHISYFVNDGQSLDMVADSSLDLVISWDSLVHAESNILESYLKQLARKLKPGGHGFLHHSNIGSYLDPETGVLKVENVHWRGTSMTAEHFREYCKEAGLACTSQEIINWGGSIYNDCLSTFCKMDAEDSGDTVVIENPRFMEEADALKRISAAFEARGDKGIKAIANRIKGHLKG